MGFDLVTNNLADKAEAGYEFELTIPGSDTPTGAFIKVRGSQSKIVRAYGRKKFEELRQRAVIAKRKGKDVEDIDLEEAEDMAVERAVVKVISWKGFEEDGKEVPFTKENATRIFKEHSWIRDQVEEEADQLLNFQ